MSDNIRSLLETLDEVYGGLAADPYRDGPRALLLTKIEAILEAPSPAFEATLDVLHQAFEALRADDYQDDGLKALLLSRLRAIFND